MLDNQHFTLETTQALKVEIKLFVMPNATSFVMRVRLMEHGLKINCYDVIISYRTNGTTFRATMQPSTHFDFTIIAYSIVIIN